MHLINEKDFMECIPRHNIDITNMDEDTKSYYFMMYSKYMELVYQYLLKNTELSKYDSILSEHMVSPVMDEYKDFYQSFSKGFLKYYYLRNTLFLERLNKEELDFLDKKILEENTTYDDETDNFIKSTLPKVTRVDGEYRVFYKSNDIDYSANPNALVLGVGIEYLIDYNEEEEEKHRNDMEFVYRNNVSTEDDLSQKLGMDVVVFDYENVYKKKEDNQMKL